MIRELGNVELFEFCETIPKVQCSHCLLYWNQGIVCCTCGQRLINSESRRKFNKLRLAALSVPNFVIKKGPTHGARHGKTKVEKEYHLAWNAWKRCCKKVDSQSEQFTGIHDRFLRDTVYRESQLAIGRTEQKCKEWDELAKEDHTYHLTPEETKRYQGQWYLTLNKAAQNGPMKLRSDVRASVLMKNRLHHESGEQVEQRLHQDQLRRWHSSSSTTVGFSCTVDCDPLTDGVCRQIHLTRDFLEHFDFVHTSHCGSRCLWCAFTPFACQIVVCSCLSSSSP